MQCNDFAEAKRLNDRIEPLMRVFYARSIRRHAQPPERSAGAAQQIAARSGAPALGEDRSEIMRIRQGLIEAGLLDKNARDAA